MGSTDLTLTILQNIRADIAVLGGKIDALERRFDHLESRFDHLESRFDNLERRFDHLEGEVVAIRKDMHGFLTRDEFRGAIWQ